MLSPQLHASPAAESLDVKRQGKSRLSSQSCILDQNRYATEPSSQTKKWSCLLNVSSKSIDIYYIRGEIVLRDGGLNSLISQDIRPLPVCGEVKDPHTTKRNATLTEKVNDNNLITF